MNHTTMNHRSKILSIVALIMAVLLSTTTMLTHDYHNSQFALVRYHTNGNFDTTFADDGGLGTDFPSGVGEEANAVAIDFFSGGNKIVAAGSAYVEGAGHQFAVARYNADGSLDTTFSGDGIVLTNFASSTDEEINAVATHLGKIVVAGFAVVGGHGQLALARYNSNGSLDTTFNGDGKVLTDFTASRNEAAHALTFDINGKIVVAGWCDLGGGDGQLALARYNGDGSLDTTFDGDGKVLTNFGANRFDVANAIAINANGKIVVAGWTEISSDDTRFALARYNSNGSLDTTFDDNGLVETNFASSTDEKAYAIAAETGGKIVVAGGAKVGGIDQFALARYNADGSLDTSFDGDGKVLTPLYNSALGSTGSGCAYAIGLSGNRITVAGCAFFSGASQIALARYNSNGSLYTGFSGDGLVFTRFGGSLNAGAYALVIDTGGRFVAAGFLGDEPLFH